MFEPGEVISYRDMCNEEGASLQRGMNFRLRGRHSVILMSLRPGAPYADAVRDDGKTLIYEGHDVPKTPAGPNPKSVDQPLRIPSGRLTQNGLFFEAATNFRKGATNAERVRVYEKIHTGIWAYAGTFELIDAKQQVAGRRSVIKFILRVVQGSEAAIGRGSVEPDHNRIIPTQVKLEVWKRDKGKCVKCGKPDNLHFDHLIPFSKGGSSLVAENIQLLCARHNLEKRDRIE